MFLICHSNFHAIYCRFPFYPKMLRRSSQRLVLTWRYKKIKRDKNENYAQIYNMKKYIKIGNKR